jgi:site-specific DNA-methyltransferase (adenine-specific)
MKIEQLNINDIRPYVHNPRRNQKTVDAVVKSLTEFGFQQPIVIDQNNVIVVGHSVRYQLASSGNVLTKSLPRRTSYCE